MTVRRSGSIEQDWGSNPTSRDANRRQGGILQSAMRDCSLLVPSIRAAGMPAGSHVSGASDVMQSDQFVGRRR